MNIVYLSLGSNLGDKEDNLRTAINEISMRIGNVIAQSAFIETMPWGFNSDNTFLNAAIKVETVLTPYDVLQTTQQIEQMLGRQTKTDNKILTESGLPEYHDRIIDIDILLYFEQVEDSAHHTIQNVTISSPSLTIPHPRMFERDFVLTPLKQIL